MKQFLLSAIALGLVSVSQLSAQCTPGSINVDFQPTINSTIPAGTVGQAYSTTILFKAPTQLTLSLADIPSNLIPSQIAPFIGIIGGQQFAVQVNSMTVNGISGQPNGLTGTVGGGVQGSFVAGQQGCLAIAGTPTEGGNFTVDLDIQYTITIDASALGVPLLTGTFPIPQPVPSPQARQYNMFVPTGIEELTGNNFAVAIAPNPFETSTQVMYNTPQPGNVQLVVYNMLGGLVYSNTFEAKAGKNTIVFSSDKLSSGMYIYSLSNGKEVRTGKLTVSK